MAKSNKITLTREQILNIVQRLEEHHVYPDVTVTIRQKKQTPHISSDIVSVEIDNQFDVKQRFHYREEM